MIFEQNTLYEQFFRLSPKRFQALLSEIFFCCETDLASDADDLSSETWSFDLISLPHA